MNETVRYYIIVFIVVFKLNLRTLVSSLLQAGYEMVVTPVVLKI